jgi:hypothetical protein
VLLSSISRRLELEAPLGFMFQKVWVRSSVALAREPVCPW